MNVAHENLAMAARIESEKAAPEWLAAGRRACELIAPTWPLDRMIAVNPWWELRQQRAEDVAARLAALGRLRMLAPEAIIDSAQALAMDEDRLARAAGKLGEGAGPGHPDASDDAAPGHWLNVSDWVDNLRDLTHRMSWHDEIIDEISRFCAGSFGADGAAPVDSGELYARWLETARQDRGIPILMGEPELARRFAELPENREAVFAAAAAELGVEDGVVEAYAHALLIDINGWASWVAYLRWQQRLDDQPHDLMLDLLAIRMAWELVLWRHVAATDQPAFARIRFGWREQQAALPGLIQQHHDAQRSAWTWQRAGESAYQERLTRRLAAVDEDASANVEPSLQAIFCIDVRSEVMRRHLEDQDPGIQTIGFAGFFGLPIEFESAGTAHARPQLPGLLKPALQAREAAAAGRADERYRRARWKELAESPPAMFTLVETLGPLYALRLLRESLSKADGSRTELTADASVALFQDGLALDLDARAALVAGILHAMGLEAQFAPTVLLAAHGSSTANNAHAASLDCGACGGQSGEVNVRLLADLLNDTALRGALNAHGINIPSATRFVPALHDTTTDQVECLDAEVPVEARGWLDAASQCARRERATSLGLAGSTDASLDAASRRRAHDWSEVRPEWGLAGNAAFIAAPRARTRGIDLEGRVFLHDYAWQADPDRKILELILTAPMVVANWINAQYGASVSDPQHLGSGSKLLHNVVGGNLGVFEGNGGDLRIGLPFQSVHDGNRWMHTPLRLSVYVDAPREAILDIYQRHDTVSDLVDNNWLYLFRLDEAPGVTERLYRSNWQVV